MSKFKGVKTDNAKILAKQQLRFDVLEAMHGHKNVLEVFCGAGEMYEAVWYVSDKYTGIDKRKYQDSRDVIIGDAVSVLRQIDINSYNIFDIDAYGSPYNCLEIILSELSLEKQNRIAFCITDGTQMDLRMGNITRAMAVLAGINYKKILGAHKMHDQIIGRIADNIAKKLNGYIVSMNIAIGATGSGMRYYSLIIEKTD